MLIWDQFGIIRSLQRFPTPQTRYFFVHKILQSGSSNAFTCIWEFVVTPSRCIKHTISRGLCSKIIFFKKKICCLNLYTPVLIVICSVHWRGVKTWYTHISMRKLEWVGSRASYTCRNKRGARAEEIPWPYRPCSSYWCDAIRAPATVPATIVHTFMQRSTSPLSLLVSFFRSTRMETN